MSDSQLSLPKSKQNRKSRKKLLLKLIFEFILSITYEKFWHSDTCGRTKSSAVNATCDPNIDLQFATASSVVKLGNWNFLWSTAIVYSLQIKWRNSSVQIDPLFVSDVLIGSLALTSSSPPRVVDWEPQHNWTNGLIRKIFDHIEWFITLPYSRWN